MGLLDTLVRAQGWNRLDETSRKTDHDDDPEKFLCHAFAQISTGTMTLTR